MLECEQTEELAEIPGKIFSSHWNRMSSLRRDFYEFPSLPANHLNQSLIERNGS